MNWEVFKKSNSQSWFVGILIRNDGGNVMAAKCGPIMSLPRGINQRIGACLQVLHFTLDVGIFYVELEGPQVRFLNCLPSSQVVQLRTCVLKMCGF